MILPLLEGAAAAEEVVAAAGVPDGAALAAELEACARYSSCSRLTEASLPCLWMTFVLSKPCMIEGMLRALASAQWLA